MSHDEIIEQAAKVLYDNNHLTPTDWADAWVLAERLDAAGLLARPMPSRDEIARALFIGSDHRNAAVMAQAWDAPGDGGRQRWWNYADAVLALMKGQDR